MAADEPPWDANVARLNALGPLVKGLVSSLLESVDIRPHSIDYRVKEKSSALRKFQNKSGRYGSLMDLTDLLGVRVITYFEDEVDKVASLIENDFEIDWENSIDKRKTLAPDRFGYLSLHYIVRLHDKRSHLVEYRRFADVRFEIQIRSVLQHAWAEVEHDLGYKPGGVVPDQAKRRFSQLASLLELADSEFTKLRSELTQHRDTVQVAVSEQRLDNVPLDDESLAAYISTSLVSDLDKKVARSIEKQLRPSIDLGYAAARAEELQHLGISDISEVDRLMKAHSDLLWRFASDWLKRPSADDDSVSTTRIPRGISIFYLILMFLVEDYMKAGITPGAALGLGHLDFDGLRNSYMRAKAAAR
ncbi:hypothetical protein [Micromonospora sp. NPDC047527]|uniref:GTP pyrophosphokinase n=1 Tax=Micromonospora sp. NPDC047527 TaxID=3155144 RepID=UPI0033CFD056